jgi:hypothetical protein
MSKLQVHRVTEASVPTGTTHAGKVYFTSERNLYVIDSAGNKIKFSDVSFHANEAAISGLSTKLQNKIYVALSEGTMWYWNGSLLLQLGANNLYAPRLQPVRNITVSSTTLAATDASTLFACTASTSQEIELPDNASVPIPVGFNVDVTQIGSGTTSIVGAGGVTLLGAGTLAFQYGVAHVIKIDTDTWLLSGDVA